MATLLCQGLQSCVESQSMEQQTVTLTLKLPSPTPTPPCPQTQCSSSPSLEPSTKTTQTREFEITKLPMSPAPGGWSFLSTDNSHYPYPKTGIFKDDFFAPTPTDNSIPSNPFCSSVLSEKSLELCTENLGNETGTEITENSIFSTLGCEVTNLPSEEQTKVTSTSTQHFGANNKHVSRSFPPPLTTISGKESIQVRPYREDGRLVIKAIKTTSLFGQFQAERSHGRLRLCLLRECNQSDEEEEEEEEVEDEKEEEEEEDDDISNMGDDNEGEEFEVENGVDGKNDIVGDKTGIEIFKRRERCKGSESRTPLNWEPFLVATS